MSLIAWYPLNGNLKNNITGKYLTKFASGEPSFVDGKTGKALLLPNNADVGLVEYLPKLKGHRLLNGLSISGWFKLDEITNNFKDFLCFRIKNLENDEEEDLRLESVSTSYGAAKNSLNWFNHKLTSTSGLGQVPVNLGEWIHITTVFDDIYKIYVNGELYNTHEYELAPSLDKIEFYDYFLLGDNRVTNYHKGAVCNIKIYNHALSQKEVIEDYKQPILHLPFNKRPEDTVRVLNTQYMSGIAYASTLGNDSNGNYFTINLLNTSVYRGYKMNDTAVTAGKIYKFSIQVKPDKPSKFRIDTNCYADNYTGNDATIDVLWDSEILYDNNYNVYDSHLVHYNDWGEIVAIVRVKDDCINPRIGHVLYLEECLDETATELKTYYKNMKLEEVTWDELTDNSGLDNKCIIHNNLIWSNISASGSYSANFNSNSYIDCGSILPNYMSAATISCWCYKRNWSDIQTPNCSIIGNIESGGLGFKIENGDNNMNLVCCYESGYYSSGSSTDAYVNISNLKSGWHLFTGVVDKNTASIYIDDKLVSEVKHNKNEKIKTFQGSNTTSNRFIIGRELGDSGNVADGFNGLIDDVRIYPITLKEEDVKQLYNVKAKTDNNGNFYINELKEIKTKNLFGKITNTTIVRPYQTATNSYKVQDGILQVEASVDHITNQYGFTLWNLGYNLALGSTYFYSSDFKADKAGKYYVGFQGISYDDLYGRFPSYMINYTEPGKWVHVASCGVRSNNLGSSFVLRYVGWELSFKAEVKNIEVYDVTGLSIKNNITRKQQLKTLELSEFNFKNINQKALMIDKYGATWLRVFHHNNKSGTVLFTDEEEALHCETENKFSILDELENYRGYDNKFEFLLEYPDNIPGLYNRWKQEDNPVKVKGVNDSGLEPNGFEPINLGLTNTGSGGFTGLLKSTATTCTFIDGNTNTGNWFYAIGVYAIEDGYNPPGMPMALGGDTVQGRGGGSADLYVRVDNIPLVKNTKKEFYTHPKAKIIKAHGATWLRVFHHNTIDDEYFMDDNEALHCEGKNKFSILDELENYRGFDNRFEFMLTLANPNIDVDITDEYNRWKQEDNPAIIDEPIVSPYTGRVAAKRYQSIHIDWDNQKIYTATVIPFGGLLKSHYSSATFIDGSLGTDNWWWSIGSKISFRDYGIPAYFNVGDDDAAVKEVNLYVRIDNVPYYSTGSKIFKDKILVDEIKEI